MGLLRGAAALAMVTRATRGDDIHPVVDSLLGKRDNVFTRQVFFMKMVTTVSADIAVTRKQLGVGQSGLEAERIDVGDALGPDDAVHDDDRLLAGHCVVTAVKHRHLTT